MHRRTLIASSAALAIVPLAVAAPAFAQTTDPENTIYLDLKQGRVVIKLLPDVAPKTVAQIKTLARQGFYDGTPFHRVIEGLHGAGRRSDRHRRRRQQAAEPAAGSQPAPFRARRVRHGPHRPIPTAATASSSSCSRRRPRWTGNTRSGARS